jgi:hypothetical protein
MSNNRKNLIHIITNNGLNIDINQNICYTNNNDGKIVNI